jgi:hypothetical protein
MKINLLSEGSDALRISLTQFILLLDVQRKITLNYVYIHLFKSESMSWLSQLVARLHKLMHKDLMSFVIKEP